MTSTSLSSATEAPVALADASLDSMVETEEQRSFARSVADAVASVWDDEALRRVGIGGVGADPEVGWPALIDTGLPAVPVPEERGGFGGRWIDTVSAVERVGEALMPNPLAPSFAAAMLLLHGSPDGDHRGVLARVADGAARLTVAADWATGCWHDAGALTVAGGPTNADGVVAVSGTVDRVLRPSADLLLVPFSRDGEVAVALVSVEHAALTARSGLDLLCPLGRVSFENAPGTIVLEGAASQGALRAAHAAATLTTAAEQVGVCRRALQGAVSHAKERTQFGAPIGSFQGISHRLADVLVETELAVTAVRHLAVVLDAVQDDGLGAGGHGLAEAVQLAHHQAIRALTAASKSLIQVLGGIGFTWESTAHHAFRKAGAQARLLGPAVPPAVRLVDRDSAVPADPVVGEFREFVRDALVEHRREWGVESSFPARRAWQQRLHSGGWIGLGWPESCGGRALTVRQQVDCERELAAAGAPQVAGVLGVNNVGPTLIALGTSEHQRHLPAILSAEEVWCQGFSEPGAGSDLAALRCHAELRDGHYIVNGQKVWTTDGLDATHIELMVRTDPDSSRHAGITMLLVPLDTPGITRRPIVQLDGSTGYAEIFFDNVRVPSTALLGAEGEGWAVSRTTLAYERTGVVALAARLQHSVRDVLDRIDPSDLDEDVARSLADTAARARLLDLHGARILSAIEAGTPPGPEQSVVKLVWSQVTQSLGELQLAAASVEALDPDDATGAAYLRSRSASIAGGTTEIMKNVIAQKVLNLPR